MINASTAIASGESAGIEGSGVATTMVFVVATEAGPVPAAQGEPATGVKAPLAALMA